MYAVYKHTCPNGKVYIGITGNDPLKRWNGGHGYNNNPHFKNAILKYGWDYIKHEILFNGLTKEEAEKKEIELIAYYKSNNPECGYNHDNGGNCTGKVSEETKQKISNSIKGIKRNPMSEETRRKLSEHRKGKCTGEQHPRFGKHHTEETKEKLRKKLIGRKMSTETLKKRSKAQSKSVLCVETNIIYKSIKEATEITKINGACICGVCRGKRKTAGGFSWTYKEC